MDLQVLLLIILSSLALFAAGGGWVSHLKNRQPLEGFVLGAVLGPIGVLVVWRMPFAHRPMVDRGAWNSFRSMVDYQSDPAMLHLTQQPGGSPRTRTR